VKLSEIKDASLREKILQADRQQNPTRPVMGGLAAAKPERSKVSALDQGGKQQCQRTGGVAVVVTLIAFRSREYDTDNNVASQKGLRDAIAASLGLDDADRRIKFQYGQIVTRGRQGVLVKIEIVENKS
jgi:hypothetical protein